MPKGLEKLHILPQIRQERFYEESKREVKNTDNTTLSFAFRQFVNLSRHINYILACVY